MVNCVIIPVMKSRDAEKTARRFGVESEEVQEAASRVENEKAIELELRSIKRDGELVEFLRSTYDKEAIAKKCEWANCGEGPWNYYDELMAHVRTHIILTGDRQAAKAMADVDKLIAPPQELVAKVTLPAGESSERLLDRVAARLAQRLASNSSKTAVSLPELPAGEADDTYIDIDSQEVSSEKPQTEPDTDP